MPPFTLDELLKLSSRQITGGVNWTPGVAARARNNALVDVAVRFGLAPNAETVQAYLDDLQREYDEQTMAAVERFNSAERERRRREAET
jgi:hypothetical protein